MWSRRRRPLSGGVQLNESPERSCVPSPATVPAGGIVLRVTLNDLLYVLVGAGLTLTAQTVVQLRVVPRAEQRKRREDRWERDLLALGELLTAELPDRAAEAKAAQWLLQFTHLAAKEVGEDPDRQRETERRLSEKADEAVERYYAIAETRASWLAKRVVGIAPSSPELRRFALLHTRFRTTSVTCTFFKQPLDNFNEDGYDQRWQDEYQLRTKLIDAVEALLIGPPRRNPTWLRRRRRALIAWGRKMLRASRHAMDADAP